MRILIVTPWVPYPITGADQQDRFCGFEQLKKRGHDIHVIAKIHAFQDRAEVERFYTEADIPLTLVPYTRSLFFLFIRRIFRIISQPALLDGAALEYTDPALETALAEAVNRFHPEVAWVEFSFLWPVARWFKDRHIPVVLRSANNEAQQSIDEHGGSLLSRIMAIPRFSGERLAAQESDVLLAITPWEEKWYRTCRAEDVSVLPLRGLPHTLRTRQHRPKDVLDVVFLSSSYSNGHNRDALEFLLKRILPEVRAQCSGAFRFHITGKKFPAAFQSLVQSDVQVHGFLPELQDFLDTMDIALCPSVTGQGMQQKIFEPLCCGLPLITHHTAGYLFEDGIHVLLAQDPKQFADHLVSLKDVERRQKMVDAAYELSLKIFSEEELIRIADEALKRAVGEK